MRVLLTFQTPGFTKETFVAFQQTLSALIGLCQYLLNGCGFNYILLGLCQSDNIESRFGWYRQLSGGNYYISMKQLIDSERKIRTISSLLYSGISLTTLDEILPFDSDDRSIETMAEEIHSQLTLQTYPDVDSRIILCYVVGACARSIINTRKCKFCKESLVIDETLPVSPFYDDDAKNFIHLISRGGLLYPNDVILKYATFCWVVFNEIKNNSNLMMQFRNASNSRRLFCRILDLVVSDNYNTFVGQSHCTRGHDIFFEMSKKLCNCFLKNFVKSLSEQIGCQKRRLSKLNNV